MSTLEAHADLFRSLTPEEFERRLAKPNPELERVLAEMARPVEPVPNGVRFECCCQRFAS